MNTHRFFGQGAFVLVMSLMGCSSEDGGGDTGAGASCTPNVAVTCACTDGTMGMQLCSADGLSLGACQCGDGVVVPGPTGVNMPGVLPTTPTSTTSPTVTPTSTSTSTPTSVPTGTGVTPIPTTTPEIQAYDELYACSINSGWIGDELCLLPPDPAEGFQLHYGPIDYDNPTEIARFTVAPGGEIDDRLPMSTPNTSEILYQEYHVRLRPGTHHMILWANDAGAASIPGIGGGRYLMGAQGALGDGGGRTDRPPPEGLAPENEGIGFRMGPQLGIEFNMHYVNTREEPILKEGWVNFHYADPADVIEIADPIAFWGAIGLSIPPNSITTDGAGCSQSSGTPVRVLALTGHVHSHATRFSAWHVTGTGSRNLVYESYNWSEPTNLLFDSIHTNSPPNPASYLDGGHSGILTVNPGERLEYECEWNNNTNSTLRFGNQTYTSEMCLLFGSYAPSIGGPWSCVVL